MGWTHDRIDASPLPAPVSHKPRECDETVIQLILSNWLHLAGRGEPSCILRQLLQIVFQLLLLLTEHKQIASLFPKLGFHSLLFQSNLV